MSENIQDIIHDDEQSSIWPPESSQNIPYMSPFQTLQHYPHSFTTLHLACHAARRHWGTRLIKRGMRVACRSGNSSILVFYLLEEKLRGQSKKRTRMRRRRVQKVKDCDRWKAVKENETDIMQEIPLLKHHVDVSVHRILSLTCLMALLFLRPKVTKSTLILLIKLCLIQTESWEESPSETSATTHTVHCCLDRQLKHYSIYNNFIAQQCPPDNQ